MIRRREGGGRGFVDGTVRGERLRGSQAIRKVANVVLHRRVPERFEMEFVHFRKSLRGSPMLEGNAIRGEKYAGAIAAEPAMNENRLLGAFGNRREELGHLLVGRRRPAIARNQNIFHSKFFRLLSLVLAVVSEFAAQIDDGGDAAFFQFFQSLFVRLRAAIEMMVQFSGILDALDVNFSGEGGISLRSVGSFRMPRGSVRRKGEEN